MIIAVTGMVGLDKKHYLEEVANLCKINSKNVSLCNVGEMMYNEAPDIVKGRILDIPMKRLSQLRRSVFKDIINKSKTCENLIVNTHATFRWRHGLFPAIDFDQMRQLNADMYVCIIDGVDVVHLRLITEHPIRHSLKDLIVWREEEMLGTEFIRNGIDPDKPFYVLARGESQTTAQTFYSLMFEQYKKKAYLSFPMTHIMDLEDVKAKILNFRQQMKEHFICFDPADLEEMYLPLYCDKAKQKGDKGIELNRLGKKFCLSIDELSQIDGDIRGQVYARDFMLIDQADMIISFIPQLPDGRAAISSGVERELHHAYEAAKEVYVIWTAKSQPSVFITQTATKVFSSQSQALEYFNNKKIKAAN